MTSGRLVAPRRVPGVRVGVGDRDRARRELGRLDRRAIGRVAHVDDEPDTVHLADDLATHAGDAGVLGLVAAGGEQGLVVVGQLHEPRAERVADLDEPDVVLDRTRVLEAEEDRRAVARASRVDVGGRPPRQDQVRVPDEALVPRLDVRHRLAKALVVGDRRVHGVDPALAHLPEHLLRPVRVLQAVDAHQQFPAPRAISARRIGMPSIVSRKSGSASAAGVPATATGGSLAAAPTSASAPTREADLATGPDEETITAGIRKLCKERQHNPSDRRPATYGRPISAPRLGTDFSSPRRRPPVSIERPPPSRATPATHLSPPVAAFPPCR